MLPPTAASPSTATPASQSPTCTIYDAPFIVGHPVWVTGCAISVVCKFTVTAAAPYAIPAAVFFAVLGGVTFYGQYRSRSTYLAQKKIIQDIATQDTELKSVSIKVGDAADAMTRVDADWKSQADRLATDKKTLEEEKSALTKLCDTLRQQVATLSSTAGRIAGSATSDAATVGRLADTTGTLATNLAAGTTAEAALKRDADQISGDLGAITTTNQSLTGTVQKVAELVGTARTPVAGDTSTVTNNLAALAESTRKQLDELS